MEQPQNNNQNSNLTTPLPALESFNVKCDQSYSQDSSQLDQDKCYLMEIEQLKRQNNFLKKKLAEFTKKQRLSLPLSANKRGSSHFGSVSQLSMEDGPQNYILSFIDEVTKLLQNFSNLFRIDLQANLAKQFQKQNKIFKDLTAQKPDELNRRLGRILFEPEETKYRTLLQIFESFYRETTENRKLLREKVQQMTSQVIQMGKRMAANVKQKQKVRGITKGSRIFPVSKQVQESRQTGQQCLKSSIIKSTCTDSVNQFGSVRLSLGKQKLFYNLF